MTQSVKHALAARNAKRRSALSAIKATQSRLKPKNLKREATEAIKTKASAAAVKTKAAARRNKGKLWIGTGLTLGTAAAALLYSPIKKRLSEKRNI